MGIFADDKSQDERIDELERQMRRVVEEVQQLSVDLGVTRTELLRARIDLTKVVKVEDVDPSLVALNESAQKARGHVENAKKASDKEWNEKREDAAKAIDDLNKSVTKALDDASASVKGDS